MSLWIRHHTVHMCGLDTRRHPMEYGNVDIHARAGGVGRVGRRGVAPFSILNFRVLIMLRPRYEGSVGPSAKLHAPPEQ